MKNCCVHVLILLLLTIQSQAQIPLTNFEGSGSNNRNEIVEVDDILYLLSINSLNEVSTYRVNGIEDKVLLHSETVGAIYSVYHYILEGEYLITEGLNSVIVYNFITDERMEYVVPEGYNLRNVRSTRLHNNKVVVTLYEGLVLTSDNQYYIGLDIITGWLGSPRKLFTYSDNWEYEYQYIPTQITIIRNEVLGTIDTFPRDHFRVQPDLVDTDAMYNHKDSMVIKYFPGLGLDTILTSQKIFPQDHVNDQHLYTDDEHIYVSETYSDYVNQTSINQIHLTVIAKQTGEIVRDTIYIMDDSADHMYSDLPDYILYAQFADSTIVVNKHTLEMKKIDSDLGNTSVLSQDPKGRLINTVRADNSNGFKLQLVECNS